MSKCDVPSCAKEASERIAELALYLCDWHAYEHHNNLGWLGKTDEDDVKSTIPKPKMNDTDDVLHNNE